MPLSAPDLKRTFRARPEAAAEARQAVDRLPLASATRETLSLVVTELVSNSIRHGDLGADSTIDLLATPGEGVVHVEVRDGGPGFAPSGTGSGAAHGYGFSIVSALSEAWGVDCEGAGCTVWCDIAAVQAA
jgi:two-component sensor histidine kinase